MFSPENHDDSASPQARALESHIARGNEAWTEIAAPCVQELMVDGLTPTKTSTAA